MWSPTHVQVVVQRAKGLITKGKNNTNDCFVTIALGKEKYQTSVKEKASENVEWHEECELQIPQQGNTAEIVLTALHRNFLGVDEFLGTVRIPLSSFDIYEMPKNRWYDLTSKPGKENTKERGKLEVRIGFIVRAGSLTDLTKKERHKSSLGQLSSAAQSFGGSLLSIGSGEKRKGLKKLAKSIGNKVKGKSRSKGRLDDIHDEEEFRVGERPRTAGQEHGDADPGVVSDEEDEFTFDDLSHKSSTSSINSSRSAAAPVRNNSSNNISNWKTGNSNSNANINNDLQNNRHGSPQLSSQEDNVSNGNNGKATVNTPPSKPPRFALNSGNNSGSLLNLASKSPNDKPQQQQIGQTKAEDEWGQKLYGLQTGNTLKRWENKRMSPKIVIEESRESTESSNITNMERNDSPISRLKGEISDTVNEGRKPGPQQALRKDKDKYSVMKEIDEKSNKKEKKEKKDKHEKHDKHKSSSSEQRIIIGGEENSRNESNGVNAKPSRLPREIAEQFEGKSREDLIEMVMHLQLDVADKKKRLHDLEDYIDSLLLRVIECSPKLLQNPFQASRRLSSPGRQ